MPAKSAHTGLFMTDSTLSTVVSQLVRASMGSSVSNDIPDYDLDRHVTELILQEAKLKEERYGTTGIRAYLPATSLENSVPKANKRFLSSVIKSTDDHNKAVLRSQALAAAEAKAKKDEEDRKERRARAKEAADSRNRHHSRHRTRHSSEDELYTRRKRKDRSWERDRRDHPDSHRSSKYDKRPSTSRSKHGPRREDFREHTSSHTQSMNRLRTHTSSPEALPQPLHDHKTIENLELDPYILSGDSSEKYSRRPSQIAAASDVNRSPKAHRPVPSLPSEGTQLLRQSDHSVNNAFNLSGSSLTQAETKPRPKAKFKPITLPKSPSPQVPSGSGSSRTVISPASSRSDSPAPIFSSKMDKYFEESYDPRLDVASLSKKPNVPKEGLIPDEEFDGWDAMLELIKQRQHDKAEKKQWEKFYGVEDKKKKKRKKGDSGIELAWETVAKKRQALSEQEPGIMDIRYQKKGALREWDMGKESNDML